MKLPLFDLGLQEQSVRCLSSCSSSFNLAFATTSVRWRYIVRFLSHLTAGGGDDGHALSVRACCAVGSSPRRRLCSSGNVILLASYRRDAEACVHQSLWAMPPVENDSRGCVEGVLICANSLGRVLLCDFETAAPVSVANSTQSPRAEQVEVVARA